MWLKICFAGFVFINFVVFKLFQRILCLTLLLLTNFQGKIVVHAVNKDVGTQQQIKLEDIEQDNLASEKIKELLETQQTQNIKTSSSEEDNVEETSKEQTRESVQYVEPSSPSSSASGINYDGYLNLRYLTPGPAINYVQTKGKSHKYTSAP